MTCLARLRGHDGRIHAAADFVHALEALSAATMLDVHMLKLVLDELEANPRAILGCNLSADSLSTPQNWAGIRKQIVARVDLAPRLVLELTETEPLSSIAMARHWLAELRDMECRIAIDNFGSRFTTPGRLLAVEADIVKIDGLFVRDLRSRSDGRSSLYHMVGLAACAAPFVVVEGIETNEHLDAALSAGATHVQGFLFSPRDDGRNHGVLQVIEPSPHTSEE